ncbi:acid protease [Russula ochroleuca]|uniref:Acid protease n=1 Tax=Russula ochroleuca TaxID=152965 RepID=A0A9P5T6K8_9AGAM|nr:acid protease [Russula ochroleuca]
MFSPLSVLLPILFHASFHVAALHFSINGKPTYSQFYKRDHISGLDNALNLNYFTNITLGEQQFSVSIDTGRQAIFCFCFCFLTSELQLLTSSDLWVAGNIVNSNDTGVSTGVQYAVGNVYGNVRTAPLTFLNFSVPGQAFIQVNSSSTYPAGQGLIGLGPNVGSNVHDALKKQPQGDTVLDRIFRQDPSTPNILTVLLSRSNDPTEQYPGEITVSDILPGMQNISNQPKLTVKSVPSSRSGDQHWQVLLDPDGIIGPDGQPMVLSTKVSGTTNSSSLTTIFDTGFTLNQVPKNVSDAIYSRIPGAEFVNVTATGPVWTMPCNVEVNITMLFGNISIPIHPLDTSFSLNASSGQICVGGVRIISMGSRHMVHGLTLFQFQPITTGASPDFDMILGMAFLRNAYLLINYGDFVDGTTTKAPPYVQLFSVTDPATAHQDFVQTRLGGVDTTGLQVLSEQPASSPDRVSSTHHEDHRTRTIVISVVAGSLVLASFAGAAYIILKRRRRRNFVTRPDFSAVDTGLSYQHTAYHPLQHAPPGEAHLVQGYHAEVGYASVYDPYAETARAQAAPVH